MDDGAILTLYDGMNKRAGRPIAPNKAPQAMEWAQRITDHVKRTYPDVEVELLVNVSGDLNQIHWLSRYSSLAQFEQTREAIDKDKKCQDLIREVQKAGPLIGVHDTFYQVVG